MKAKDFVKQLKKLDKLIENKLIEKQQWKSIALGTTVQSESVKINGVLHNTEKVKSSAKSRDNMADAIARCVDVEAEIDAYIDELVDRKKEVLNVIEQLDVDEYDLLHKMYVGKPVSNHDGTMKIVYMTLGEVAYLNDKSYKWATLVHGRALANVQKILNEREKK